MTEFEWDLEKVVGMVNLHTGILTEQKQAIDGCRQSIQNLWQAIDEIDIEIAEHRENM